MKKNLLLSLLFIFYAANAHDIYYVSTATLEALKPMNTEKKPIIVLDLDGLIFNPASSIAQLFKKNAHDKVAIQRFVAYFAMQGHKNILPILQWADTHTIDVYAIESDKQFLNIIGKKVMAQINSRSIVQIAGHSECRALLYSLIDASHYIYVISGDLAGVEKIIDPIGTCDAQIIGLVMQYTQQTAQ